jgi:hypothetical protein
MTSRVRFDNRYQIPDEPQRPMWAKIVIPPFFLLPLTIYLTLSYSPLFALLPAVNGFLVNGNHKWRDLGLSCLALFLLIAGGITRVALARAGLIGDLAQDYLADFVLAAFVFPLLKVLADQQRTMDLRRLAASR